MDVVTKKYYKCVSCPNLITHVQIEHTINEACVPDQSNCDFSTYDYKVEGGKLFPVRPPVKEKSHLEELLDNIQLTDTNANAPVGGLCNNCLETESTKNLIASARITFAEIHVF